MLDILAGVFSSSGLGAAIGLVGSWITKKEERKNLELTLSHEKDMYHLQSALQRYQTDMRLKLAEQEGAAKREHYQAEVTLKELNAFEVSQKSNQALSNSFAEMVRGLMRPLITFYLLSIATLIAVHINSYVGDVAMFLQKQDLLNLYQDTLNQFMFLTTTSVTWWFGSRPGNFRKN